MTAGRVEQDMQIGFRIGANERFLEEGHACRPYLVNEYDQATVVGVLIFADQLLAGVALRLERLEQGRPL